LPVTHSENNATIHFRPPPAPAVNLALILLGGRLIPP
jgi:hypothetical protein